MEHTDNYSYIYILFIPPNPPVSLSHHYHILSLDQMTAASLVWAGDSGSNNLELNWCEDLHIPTNKLLQFQNLK